MLGVLNPKSVFNVTSGPPVRVDWTKPITNGLLAAYLPGYSKIDLAGINGDLVFTTTSQQIAVGEGFGYNDTASTFTLAANANNRSQTWTDFTIYVRFMMASTNSTNNFWSVLTDVQAHSPIAIGGDTSGRFLMYTFDFVAVTGSTTGGYPADTITHSVGCTQSGANWKMYADGNNTLSGAGLSGPPGGHVGPQFGCSGNASIGAQTVAMYFWTRALTPAEFAYLNWNPYGAFLVPNFDWPQFPASKTALTWVPQPSSIMPDWW